MNLETLRESIDAINRSLVDLFSERLEVARHIAHLKKEAGLSLLDEEREKTQMKELRALALSRKIDPDVIEKIFALYVDYTRDEMKNL